MTELVCIVCPKGCRLIVKEDDNYRVPGMAAKGGRSMPWRSFKTPSAP